MTEGRAGDGAAGPVVVGVDPSGSSDEAIGWAADEAARRGTELILAHSVPPPSTMFAEQNVTPERMWRAGEALLLARRDDVHERHPELTVHVELTRAGRNEALLEQAERAALVVVGSRQRGPSGRLLLGSTSHFMVTHCRIPVAVVRHRATDPRAPIVVGIDGTDASRDALRYAFARAAEGAVPLLVLHAWQADFPVGYGRHDVDGDDLTELRLAAEATVAAEVARVAPEHPAVEVRSAAVQGAPTVVLADAAPDAQLLVVGSHGRGAWDRFVLGSVSTNLLYVVGRPLVIVRCHDEQDG